MYTPEQRLDIYMQLLPIFELEHPFKRGLKCGFCHNLRVFDVSLQNLPELISQKPADNFIHWFPLVLAQQRDNNRCEVLYKAIEDVLKIIHNER